MIRFICRLCVIPLVIVAAALFAGAIDPISTGDWRICLGSAIFFLGLSWLMLCA